MARVLPGTAAVLAAAIFWCAPTSAQTPPASSQELGLFAARELAAGRYEASLKAAEDRLKADGRDGRAAFVRASSLTRLGRGADAVAAFERYAKAGGKHRELDREWGLALMAAGHPGEAGAKFASFARANPDRAEVNLLIADAAMRASQYDNARVALKAAYAVEGLRPAALSMLVGLEQALDHSFAAYTYLVELLARYPSSSEAKLYSAILKKTVPLSERPDAL